MITKADCFRINFDFWSREQNTKYAMDMLGFVDTFKPTNPGCMMKRLFSHTHAFSQIYDNGSDKAHGKKK